LTLHLIFIDTTYGHTMSNYIIIQEQENKVCLCCFYYWVCMVDSRPVRYI